MDELTNLFDEKLKIISDKQKERRDARAKRRIDGESDVSEDSAEEETLDFEKMKVNYEKRFTYEELVDGLKENKFKKICVVTGAGISVSAGIPDFRSPKTGLYANLQQYNLPRPESMFDLAFFREQPEAFYHLAKEFLNLSKFNPTPTHWFIKLLDDKKILQINMTQNIDNLESKTGIDMERVVQAHGANVGALCSKCGDKKE